LSCLPVSLSTYNTVRTWDEFLLNLIFGNVTKFVYIFPVSVKTGEQLQTLYLNFLMHFDCNSPNIYWIEKFYEQELHGKMKQTLCVRYLFFCLGENCVFEIFMMSSHMLRSVGLIFNKILFWKS